MPVDERGRHKLYLAFEHLIGTDKADTLMAMLPPVGWADVATKRDLDAVAFELRAAFERGLREQTRIFVTWLLASQASMVALIVAALAFFR
jgi:hypothetical protein